MKYKKSFYDIAEELFRLIAKKKPNWWNRTRAAYRLYQLVTRYEVDLKRAYGEK